MGTDKVSQRNVYKTSKLVVLLGVIVFILGIIAMIYPASFGEISTVVIGVFLLIGGMLRFIFAIVSFSMGSLLTRYFYAILMIIAGIWIIMNPDIGLEVLTIAIAVYFIIDGFTQIIYSFSLVPIGGGLFLLISGIIGILLGILIFSKWPESSNYVLGFYIGIKLVIDGLMLAATGSAIRKFSKKKL